METALATIAVLLIPGVIIARLSGVRWLAACASAGPISIGVIGYSAWVTGQLGLPHNMWTALAATACAASLAFLLARYVPITNHSANRDVSAGAASNAVSTKAVVAIAVAAATFISVVRGVLAVSGLRLGASTPREAWDMHWHYNFLRFISDTSIASPTLVGQLSHQETGNPDFYPAAWHAVASLPPGDVFQQANIFAVVGPALILPLGIAYLTHIVAGPKWAPIAAPAAAIASLAIPQLWLGLLMTSSMPYLLAVAAIPATVALLIRGHSIVGALAIIGVMLTHPAAGVTVALFVALWWLCAPRLGRALRLALTGVATAAIIAPILLAAADMSDEVAGFTGQNSSLSRADSMLWAVTGLNNYTHTLGVNWPLFALAIIGFLIFAFRRRPFTFWPTVAFAVLWLIADNAQVRYPDPFGSWIRTIGALYYDMSYRLQAPMDVLRLVAIGVAISAAVQVSAWLLGSAKVTWAKKWAQQPASSSNGFSVHGALALGMICAVALIPATWSSATNYQMAVQQSNDNALLSDADGEALDWLATQPHAFEGHILNNLTDASGLMYARNGLPSLFRHFSWPEDDAKRSKTALRDADLAGTGMPGNPQKPNSTDIALRALGIRYVFVSPPEIRSSGDSLALNSWAWWSPGIVPVYKNKSATIFAVKDQFTPAELESVVRSSPYPPGAPNPVWVPPRQPIVAPKSEVDDPLAGARVALDTPDSDDTELRLMTDAIARAIHKRGGEVVKRDSGTGNVSVTLRRAPTGVGHVGGFAVSGHYPAGEGITANDDAAFATIDNVRQTWQLAASIRDGLVFHNVKPASTFDAQSTPTHIRHGLYPQELVHVGDSDIAAVDVFTGVDADLTDPAVRASIVDGIVDGITSLLRQNPELASPGFGDIEFDDAGFDDAGFNDSVFTRIPQ